MAKLITKRICGYCGKPDDFYIGALPSGQAIPFCRLCYPEYRKKNPIITQDDLDEMKEDIDIWLKS